MQVPFTYEQAVDIAEDFSDLEDTGLLIDIDGNTIACHIQKVAVTPFQAAEKEIFIEAYKIEGDADKALSGYSGNEYNVMIIAKENDEIIALSIHEYTSAYGVNYKYP